MTIEELASQMIEAREKATPGEWRWQDQYDFREHKEHQRQGLDADCENIAAGRISLEPNVLSEWAEYASDSGLSISLEDAAFITLAANHASQLAKACLVMEEALKFYAGAWGEHQGSPIKGVNLFTQNKLNDSRATAIEARAEVARILESKNGK